VCWEIEKLLSAEQYTQAQKNTRTSNELPSTGIICLTHLTSNNLDVWTERKSENTKHTTEKQLWLLQCTCHPTSPKSLTCHINRDSDHPPPTKLIVPSYSLTTVGRRAFPVSAANLWNSLPAHHTSPPSHTVLVAASWDFSLPAILPWLIIQHSKLIFCCGPSSNYVI